jgi:lysyl-tRNA synthetase class 2
MKVEKAAREKAAREKEDTLNVHLFFENRSKAVTALKGDKDNHPYPHKFNVQLSVKEFIDKYDYLTKDQRLEEQASAAGRITNYRRSGKNFIFYDIRDDGLKLQVMCNIKDHKGPSSFEAAHEHIKRGDIIGVIGHPTPTTAGELSIAPVEIKLLSPCLNMLL